MSNMALVKKLIKKPTRQVGIVDGDVCEVQGKLYLCEPFGWDCDRHSSRCDFLVSVKVGYLGIDVAKMNRKEIAASVHPQVQLCRKREVSG